MSTYILGETVYYAFDFDVVCIYIMLEILSLAANIMFARTDGIE